MTWAPPRLVVAVDVGGTSVKAALVEPDGRAVSRRRLPVAEIAPGQVVDAVLEVVAELVGEAEAGAAGTGAAGTGAGAIGAGAIGLAVPGIVDERAGVGRSSMILGWRDVPFRQLLERFDKPVAFGHDVSAGAYAESRRGAAIGHRDWLFLALGTGLGSTFVLDDRPYRGSNGTGGELAHVVVRPGGPLCRCGKTGCLEMVSTGPAVATAYGTAAGLPPGAVTAADVSRLASEGDPRAQLVWGEAVEALADAVAGYVEALNPSLVVVGGGLAEAGQLLLTPLATAVSARVAFADPAPVVTLAHWGADAALVGMAVAAHELAAHELAAPGTGRYGNPFQPLPPPPSSPLPPSSPPASDLSRPAIVPSIPGAES